MTRKQGEDFIEWMHANPKAWEVISDVALRAYRDHGYQHWSIQGVFEVARWERHVSTTDADFALNNNHAAMAARFLMHRKVVPEGFFETRERQS